MKEKINPDNDGIDPSDEYFKKKYDKVFGWEKKTNLVQEQSLS